MLLTPYVYCTGTVVYPCEHTVYTIMVLPRTVIHPPMEIKGFSLMV